jgi:general L-amino acid transport system substrate-binding protein
LAAGLRQDVTLDECHAKFCIDATVAQGDGEEDRRRACRRNISREVSISMKSKVIATALGAAFAVAATFAQAATLDTVKQRGELVCGSNTGLAGFGIPNEQGQWSGFDVDYCRAVAAAIFNDPAKVKFIPLSAKDRFTALQSGEIDVLIRNTTWTISRDTQGMNFPVVNYFDGQGFLVKKALGVKSALELSGASVCTQQGTTTELNLADFFRANNLPYQVVTFATSDETRQAYDSGRCDAFTTDASGLYAERLRLNAPDDHMVLPEIISKEPLGPAVRHGDDQWHDIIGWTHYALLTAEELGVTQANVDEMLKSDKPDIKRLLGTEGDFGKQLGLDNNWAYNIIKKVGNYSEIFDRNVGAGSPLKIERGVNALWTKKGLQYAPPIR